MSKPNNITVTDDKGNTYKLSIGNEDKPYTVYHTIYKKNGRVIKLSVIFSDNKEGDQ